MESIQGYFEKFLLTSFANGSYQDKHSQKKSAEIVLKNKLLDPRSVSKIYDVLVAAEI